MIGLLQTGVVDGAMDFALEEIFDKRISPIAKISFGTIQILIGTVIFPLQFCGRVFRANKPLLFGEGLSTLIKTRSLGKAIFGSIQIIVGIVLLPLQITGRIFSFKQPFYFKKGYANIVSGSKAFRLEDFVLVLKSYYSYTCCKLN